MSDMEENTKTKMLREELGEHYHTVEQLKKLKSYQGAQARMPFEVVIR
jgi:hypothetical protein